MRTIVCRIAVILALVSLVPSVVRADRVTQTTNPASVTSEWQDVGTTVTTADNSGSIVTNPGSISTLNTTRLYVSMQARFTSVQFRLKYPTAGTVTTNIIVQPFGLTLGGLYQRLVDATALHQIPLTVDTTNDVRDGTYSYTQPAEVDASACDKVLIAVYTALAGTSLTGATIQARVK